jgi:plasmid stabilization system protein ParE
LASVKLLPPALADLERLVGFLLESDPEAAGKTPSLIFEGLRVLAEHPLIGRPAGVNRRELVIFRGRTGYIAQYSYKPDSDEVLVVAIRHQREVDL